MVLSLGLTAVLVAAFLWNVDLGGMVREVVRADPAFVAAAVGLALLSYWLRALRWGWILRPSGSVRHSSLIMTTAVGYLAILLLPARMGELVRPVLLARRERLPVSATLASILTERIFDLWTVVLFFMVFLLWPPELELAGNAPSMLDALTISGWVVAAGLIVGTGVLLLLFRYQERFVALVTAPIGKLRERWGRMVGSFLHHFLDGLRVLERPRDLIVTTALSIATWMAIYWQLKVSLWAFDVDVPLRVTFLLVTLTVIGLAVPTPGGVGGFHKMLQIGLAGFVGVELTPAAGIAVAYHVICFVPIALVGLACMPALSLAVTDVGRVGREADAEMDAT